MKLLSEEVFEPRLEDEFDDLPLLYQALHVQLLKKRYERLNKRHQKNCGIKGGRPNKYTNEHMELLLNEIDKIKKTQAYLDRRETKRDTKTALKIIIERDLSTADGKDFLESESIKMTDDFVRETAEALKQALYRYKKQLRKET